MKCKNCSKKITGDPIVGGIFNYCSKQHRLDYNRALTKKYKEKQKIRLSKLREKKRNSISYLKKIADTLWSECIKINYNYTCQYCGSTINRLNSHHLFSRSRNSTRWDIDNGIVLCCGCHTLSSTFSAHKTILEFTYRLEGIRGKDWIDKLNKKSQGIYKVTSDGLKDIIKELELFKETYSRIG